MYLLGTILIVCSIVAAVLAAVSYALVPRPNTLYNIAQCQERLNRYDLAILYYEQYLNLAPADAEDRPTVEASMRALRNLLGIIVVASNVAAEVWVGGRVVGVAPGEVPIPGGRHPGSVAGTGLPWATVWRLPSCSPISTTTSGTRSRASRR